MARGDGSSSSKSSDSRTSTSVKTRSVSAANVDSNRMGKVMCVLNEVLVCLVLDTGASVLLLSAYDYEKYFKSKFWLGSADVVLSGYDGSHIECLDFVR